MGVRFFRSNGTAVDVSEILTPLLELKGGDVTTTEMTTFVVDQIKLGEIQMDPSAERLREIAVAERVGDWSEKAKYDGSARFFVDRKRGRFDRKTGQIAKILDLEKEQYIASIRQSMMEELPGAYRSQARLWAELDPGLDAGVLADACVLLVSEAIKAGVKDARDGGGKTKAA